MDLERWQIMAIINTFIQENEFLCLNLVQVFKIIGIYNAKKN